MRFGLVIRHVVCLWTSVSLSTGPSYGLTASIFNSGGINRTTADYVKNVSRQANANRQMANELYQRALTNERNAWSSFPPNVNLLAKSLEQTRSANKLDKQAMHSAAQAVSALNSGSFSGNKEISDYYGTMDRKQLTDMASNPSPLWPKVNQTLNSYNISLNADGSSVNTPVGDFSVNASKSEIANGARDFVDRLKNGMFSIGIDLSGALDGMANSVIDQVMQGMTAGEQSRDALAAQVDQAMEKVMAQEQADQEGENKIQKLAQQGMAEGDPAEAGPEVPIQQDLLEQGQVEGQNQNFALDKYIDQLNHKHSLIGGEEQGMDEIHEKLERKRRGIAGARLFNSHKIANKNQNIFFIVHRRYQISRKKQRFLE